MEGATSNTRASADSPSVDNLSLCFGTLHVNMYRRENNNDATCLSDKPLVMPSYGSLPRIQQQQTIENKVQRSVPVPTPLLPQNIGAPSVSSNRGETTRRVSPGFAAPSSFNNATSAFGPLSGRDYRFSNHLNLQGGVLNQDSYLRCQSEATARGLSYQQNLDAAGSPNEIRFESLEDYCFFWLALDQVGSMYLQRKVALKDPRITCKIFKGVIGFIFHLMTNKDGSYLFGKLIESCDEIQLQVIVSKITSQSDLFIKAVKDKWGSNSIKNLIKVLVRSHLVSNLIPLLYNEFYGLMIDDIGYSVVVKCIDLLDTETNDLLYQAAFEHYLALAINERGCISLNAFITNSKGLARGQLLTLISGNSLFLAFDPIGNFVVQHVLKLHNPFINEKIFSSLKGHYVSLSQLKGGSHVVERCLESTGTYHVLDDFLRSNDLLKVAQDKYGNYVIQTALRFLKQTHNPLYQNLLMKLQPLLDPTSLQSKYVTKVRNMIASEIWHKKP